jgi:eukaryotic-like serine/threonine-protein kinase
MLEVHAQIRYQRQEQIGKGEGMNSFVFRAFDPYLQREIAVKEIEKKNFGNDFAAYCAEARTMLLVASPNIVPIHYVCETPDLVGLALPFFPNGSLKSRIADGPLNLRQLLKMSHDVFGGVSKIHTSKSLHLDLKPSNVLFDNMERALIADFGQSRQITSIGTVKSPEMYRWAMPPEVWDTHIATVETDIYQLGGLLYRAANGEPVYLEQKKRITSNFELQKLISRGRFPDLKFFLPHIPARIRTIIRKAMKIDPAERYHSVSELAADMRRVRFSLDWSVQSLGGGSYNWRAVRGNSPDLEVSLMRSVGSEWQTCVWTNGSEKRAKGLSDYWRKNLSYTEACKHLTGVFEDLVS